MVLLPDVEAASPRRRTIVLDEDVSSPRTRAGEAGPPRTRRTSLVDAKRLQDTDNASTEEASPPSARRASGAKRLSKLEADNAIVEGMHPASARRASLLDVEITSLKDTIASKDEYINDLKQVVRAQHGKIEELRTQQPENGSAKEDQTGAKVKMYLLDDLRAEEHRRKEDCKDLEAKVRRLTIEIKQLRSKNTDLKRTNKRYADMLASSGLGTFQTELSDYGTDAVSPSPLGRCTSCASIARCTSCASLENPSPQPLSRLEMRNPASSPPPRPDVQQQDHQQVGDASGNYVPQNSPSPLPVAKAAQINRSPQPEVSQSGNGAIARFAQAARSVLSLWKEDDPRKLFGSFLYGAEKLLEGNSSSSDATTMLFIADPWLRGVLEACSEADAGASDSYGQLQKPTTFYLAGKTVVHGYRRKVNSKAEAPRFPELAALPFKERCTLALPLQAGHGRTMLAALQIRATAKVSVKKEHGPLADMPDHAQNGSHSENHDTRHDHEASEIAGSLSLSDGQVAGLQLLCSTAAGILETRRRLERIQAVQERARECLRIGAEVQGSHNLTDFEQAVKIHMVRFFGVATVRLTFYDPASDCLLMTATAKSGAQSCPVKIVGRRNITRISTQHGVVGRCVRKKQMCKIDRVVASPFVSESADGVDIHKNGEVNMIVGPLLARISDHESRVMGVLQLIEKKRSATQDATVVEVPTKRARCDPFTEEDESFFKELLNVFAIALHRTIQVQSRGDDTLQEVSLEKLLAG